MEQMTGVAIQENQTLLTRTRRFLRHRLRKLYKKLRGAAVIVHFLNRKSKALFEAQEQELSHVQTRILKELKENGISKTSLDELFPESDYLKRLQEYIERFGQKQTKGRKKEFLRYLWGEDIEKLDVENPFNLLAIEDVILKIVNGYMGLFAHFFFSSGNITIPVLAAPAGSQRWHRDPGSGDERIVKIFLYINDTPVEAGPFEYIRGSHNTGPYGNIFPFVQPDGTYPAEGAVEANPVLKQNILSNVGTAGTVIICDTTGLHRGGNSRGKERIMATAAYTSPGSLQGFRFKITHETKESLQQLPAVSQYALGLKR